MLNIDMCIFIVNDIHSCGLNSYNLDIFIELYMYKYLYAAVVVDENENWEYSQQRNARLNTSGGLVAILFSLVVV